LVCAPAPRLAARKLARRTTPFGRVPRGRRIPVAHQAHEALPRRRPRFRGLSPSSVGAHRRRISSRAASLALLGFILPGAFPFPKLGLSVATPDLTTACGNSACCFEQETHQEATRARPPSALRGDTLRVGIDPVLKVSKIREIGLPLFEAAGPLRFLSSSPPGGVSDRPIRARVPVPW
jgi:hypothetical protein